MIQQRVYIFFQVAYGTYFLLSFLSMSYMPPSQTIATLGFKVALLLPILGKVKKSRNSLSLLQYIWSSFLAPVPICSVSGTVERKLQTQSTELQNYFLTLCESIRLIRRHLVLSYRRVEYVNMHSELLGLSTCF